jgi:glycerol-3-phosphate dehydrogenase
MTRSEILRQLTNTPEFDLVVIGGGATGLGIALEASRRGYRVALLESHDFAKGTSSRSTKLVHGGVRYLAQGNIGLVREALHERSVLLHDVPHLAQPIPFVMPSYRWWETGFYGMGLKLYDFLAGAHGLGRTEFLNSQEVLKRMPGLKALGLRGGVQYWDGQFDDARLAVNLARTAQRDGALLMNYCPVTHFHHDQGRLHGLTFEDQESGESFRLSTRCVINATGVWVDHLRQLDAQAQGKQVQAMVAPSQGVHLVVERDFLPGGYALLVPKTADGRVLFAVPWLGKVILGTTDTPRQDLPREPQAFDEEVDFILRESTRYLAKAPKRSDVKSVWVGLRPLVKPSHEEGSSTKGLSREHSVSVSQSGLITVTGGKWTTYRAMAQDTLSQCLSSGLLPSSQSTQSAPVHFVGADIRSPRAMSLTLPQGLHLYGDEAALVQDLPGNDTWLLPGLSEAMVRFAVRYEYARCVEDVLARRSRALFLDAQASLTAASAVAAILQSEGCINVKLSDYIELATAYSLPQNHN